MSVVKELWVNGWIRNVFLSHLEVWYQEWVECPSFNRSWCLFLATFTPTYLQILACYCVPPVSCTSSPARETWFFRWWVCHPHFESTGHYYYYYHPYWIMWHILTPTAWNWQFLDDKSDVITNVNHQTVSSATWDHILAIYSSRFITVFKHHAMEAMREWRYGSRHS